MAMMQMSSVFSFGKYKGKSVAYVAEHDPGYLCWLRKTGFGDLGKEPTLYMDEWEEKHADEVARIVRSVARKRNEQVKSDEAIDDHPPVTKTAGFTRAAPSAVNASWGSW